MKLQDTQGITPGYLTAIIALLQAGIVSLAPKSSRGGLRPNLWPKDGHFPFLIGSALTSWLSPRLLRSPDQVLATKMPYFIPGAALAK